MTKNLFDWYILAVPCEEPPKVPDAVMFGGGFVFGAHVYYNCNKGYKLKGPDTLTCGEDGKWVGETPVCKGEFLSWLSFCTFFSLYMNEAPSKVNE